MSKIYNNNEFMKDRYFAAIFCRYYYMVSYIYERRTGNMVTMSCYMDNNLSDMKAAFERDGFEVIVL